MKWYAIPALLALTAVPYTVRAQEVLPIGKIPQIDDKSATVWGISGMEMIKIQTSIGNTTPIMRTETMDARTVEILSRTQAPPLRASDVKVVSRGGHDYIVVRRYLLTEVLPEDAAFEHSSKASIASRWAAAVRRVLPQVAPTPSRLGF